MNAPRAIQFATAAPIPAEVLPPLRTLRSVPVKLRGYVEYDAHAVEVNDHGVLVLLDVILPADALIETVFTDPSADRQLRVFGEVAQSTFLVSSNGHTMPAAWIRFFGLDADGRALLRDFVSLRFSSRTIPA